MKLVSLGATVTVLCLWGAIGLLASPLSAGDSGQKKPPAEQAYTITQLDTGANVASSAQLISDNGVVAGNLQEGSAFSFVWSAQTGFVVLTLGGTESLVTGVSVNGIATGAADTPGGRVAWLHRVLRKASSRMAISAAATPFRQTSRAAVWLSAARASLADLNTRSCRAGPAGSSISIRPVSSTAPDASRPRAAV